MKRKQEKEKEETVPRKSARISKKIEEKIPPKVEKKNENIKKKVPIPRKTVNKTKNIQNKKPIPNKTAKKTQYNKKKEQQVKTENNKKKQNKEKIPPKTAKKTENNKKKEQAKKTENKKKEQVKKTENNKKQNKEKIPPKTAKKTKNTKNTVRKTENNKKKEEILPTTVKKTENNTNKTIPPKTAKKTENNQKNEEIPRRSARNPTPNAKIFTHAKDQVKTRPKRTMIMIKIRSAIQTQQQLYAMRRRVAADSTRLRQSAAENKEMRKEIEALKEAQKRFEVESQRKIEELENSSAESKREKEHQLEMLKQRKLLKKQMKEEIKAKKIVERKKREETQRLRIARRKSIFQERILVQQLEMAPKKVPFPHKKVKKVKPEAIFQPSEQQKIFIETLCSRKDEGEIVITKLRYQIKVKDIKTLYGNAWLNDEIINLYMQLISERSRSPDKQLPSVYSFSSFFAYRLLKSGYKGVRRHTTRTNLFGYDLILVPQNYGNNHWWAAIINLKEKTIKSYDSMDNGHDKLLHALANYLELESMDKLKVPYDTSQFVIEAVRDMPKQDNHDDCGVFTCMAAEYVTRGQPLTFQQKDMPNLRQKMILEIANGKLTDGT